MVKMIGGIGCKSSISEEKAGKVFSRGETHTGVRYANFKEDKFSYLNITILGYSHVDRTPQCSLACLETATCFSYNLAAKPDINGKLLCELLPSDKYNNSDKFVSNEFFHHFSIASPCSGWPCKNDGTCLALYEENSYRCICNAGFTGRDCKNDIDECSSENNCHVNANCTNTLGSYNCTCKKGYEGDGRNCSVKDCWDIKTKRLSRGDSIYLLNPDGGSPSNAFQAYCDMTSYNGGWTMCYTTDEYARPRMEVTYNAKTPYGSDGYRTDYNNIPFTEIMFVDHQTGKKAYFKQKSNFSVKAAAQYGETGSALGLWDAVGASTAYYYQLLICDHSFYTGFFVSGFTHNCYKHCYSWCNDRSSPYFRTASTDSGFKGVAFNVNGHYPRNVSSRLMSAGLR
ncbi:uncharacterized protein [Montipora foliosa]|uniref:uncharacterized protein isoform X2 n=1 Tax=Montipora foliosa TaxID=591990 RepID=UPI0035F1EBA3